MLQAAILLSRVIYVSGNFPFLIHGCQCQINSLAKPLYVKFQPRFFFNTSRLHSLENSYNENADAVLTTAHQYEHAAIIGFCDLNGLC